MIGEAIGGTDWKRLRDLIREVAVIKDVEHKLASGVTSKTYFDLRLITLHPEASFLTASLIMCEMIELRIRALVGPAVAAVPIVSAIACLSWADPLPIQASFVRSVEKMHGTGKRIEGYLPRTGPVLLVDDVATSGQSILTCHDVAREVIEPNEHQLAYVIVDREEGASAFLAQRGIELRSLFKMSDFS